MKNIGKYQVEEKIGVGGFGEVFKGYDPFIKRHVAIKTCNSEDDGIRSRFFQEAEIAGNLHHRNVTTVYDFGVHDDLPYLIQEYLSGEDLDNKIKRREFLPFAEKLYYLIQIARGLAYAHSKGVIHRDVKPSNIRILEDGTTKIMDFGIAKLAQQENGLTQTGTTLGTAAYLAPEQIRGEPIDHRSDIFSFGVLAYELLTYERPFQGKRIPAVLYQLMNREPKPIAEVWPEAPSEIIAVVDRCLRKEASRRYADGSELLRDLEAVQKRSRSAAPPGRPAQTRVRSSEVPAPAAAYERSDQVTLPIRTAADQPTQSLICPPMEEGAVGPPVGEGVVRPPQGQGPVRPPLGQVEPDADPRIETTDGADGGMGELEYTLNLEDKTLLAAPPAAQRSPFSATTSLVIFLLLATVAAAAGWWLGTHSEPDAAPGTDAPEVDLGPPEDVAPSPATEPLPGALSIRPLPGRPQGRVWIDGELLGPTPIARLEHRPGTYELEIRSGDGEDDGLRKVIVIQPGEETIVSFDLEAGKILPRHKPLAAGGGR